MFGIEHIKTLVGEINVFDRLMSDSRVCARPNHTISEGPSAIRRDHRNTLKESPAKDSKVIFLQMMEECNFRWCSALKQAMHRMHPITKTLGLELLQGIIDSFLATDPRTLCELEQSYNANERCT